MFNGSSLPQSGACGGGSNQTKPSRMNYRNAEEYPGKKVVFYANPEKAVIGCLEQPGAVKLVGEVIGTYSIPPYGPGKIPDVGLVVRGRSGRKLRISGVHHYAELFETYTEADASLSNPSD